MRRAVLLIAIGLGLLIASSETSGKQKPPTPPPGAICGVDSNGKPFCCWDGYCYPAP